MDSKGATSRRRRTSTAREPEAGQSRAYRSRRL